MQGGNEPAVTNVWRESAQNRPALLPQDSRIVPCQAVTVNAYSLLLPAGLVVSLGMACQGFSHRGSTFQQAADRRKVMSKLVLSLLVAAAVLLTGTGMLWAAEDTVTHEGSITKVDKDQLTVKSAEAQTVVALSPTTKI